jgi:hypothetical protein
MYETSESLKNENEVASRISSAWNTKLNKLPIKYRVDYAAERNGKIVAWIEVKTRKYNMNDFDSFMLSLDKYNASVQLGSITNLPVTLVVRWKDKIGYADLLHCRGVIKMGGRKDRGDPQDIQPAAYIPIDDFREL